MGEVQCGANLVANHFHDVQFPPLHAVAAPDCHPASLAPIPHVLHRLCVEWTVGHDGKAAPRGLGPKISC